MSSARRLLAGGLRIRPIYTVKIDIEVERIERVACSLSRSAAGTLFGLEHRPDSIVELTTAKGQIELPPGCTVILTKGGDVPPFVWRQNVSKGILYPCALARRQISEIGDPR